MVKIINFIDWLNKKSISESEMDLNSEFQDGSKKPTPELRGIANQIVTKIAPDSFDQVQASPNPQSAQSRVMKIAQQGLKKMNPKTRKTYPVSDIAKATASSMGFNNLMQKGTE